MANKELNDVLEANNAHAPPRVLAVGESIPDSTKCPSALNVIKDTFR
jgi:hypothetical protein